MSRREFSYPALLALSFLLGSWTTAGAQKGEIDQRSKSLNHRSDPKCSFLREEFRRVEREGEEVVSASRLSEIGGIAQLGSIGATVQDLADYVATSEEFAARLTVLRLRSSSCDRGDALSSLDRLASVDVARQKHILRVQARWEKLGGSSTDPEAQSIFARLNAVYDAEAQSFYNSASARDGLDPDIIKDYSGLLALVDESSLEAEYKRFLRENSRFLKYEEAGRLYNLFKGLDPNGSMSYAYALGKSLKDRAGQETAAANRLAQAEAAKRAEQTARVKEGIMDWVWVGMMIVILAVSALMMFFQSRRYAKYRAIRDGKLIVPYWWNTRKLILWEPGEAVVLLRNKKMVAMADATGGLTSISAWGGEEYKGRLTYKTQMMNYTSDPIHTSDGMAIQLEIGIWWQIQNPNTYVQHIATDYHEEAIHRGEPRSYETDPSPEQYYDRKLTETAEKWLRIFAGSTLREHICQLSTAKVISPYVQTYIHHYFQPDLESGEKYENWMSTTLDQAKVKLNDKTMEYGIRVEKLEVNKLNLPHNLEQKMETVRLSFLEPPKAAAETEAKTIEGRGLNHVQLEALQGLAAIIGGDNVAKIEFLKAIGIAKIPFVAPYAPPLSMLQSVFASPQTLFNAPSTASSSGQGPRQEIPEAAAGNDKKEGGSEEPPAKSATAGSE